jgi:Cu-processing system ATP-binding protein
MQQRVEILKTLYRGADVLILDEPTAGLDPRSATILKDKILADRGMGRTFLITSHVMSELEELADNVMFISEGRVRFSGSIGQIKDLTRQVNLERAVAELMERGVAA